MTQYLPQKPAAIPLIAALVTNSYFLYGNIGVMTAGIVPYLLDQSSSETLKAINWFIERGTVRSSCICHDLKEPCNPLTIPLSFNNRLPLPPLPLPLPLSLAPPHTIPQSPESSSSAPSLLSLCSVSYPGRSHSCYR